MKTQITLSQQKPLCLSYLHPEIVLVESLRQKEQTHYHDHNYNLKVESQ